MTFSAEKVSGNKYYSLIIVILPRRHLRYLIVLVILIIVRCKTNISLKPRYKPNRVIIIGLVFKINNN